VLLLVAVGAAYLSQRRRADASNPWADEEEGDASATGDDEQW
jgi:hypothetical protein